METGHDIANLARAEISARHRFFKDWFTGKCEDDALRRAMSTFAPEFWRIAPDGSLQTREQLQAALQDARGAMPASFSITVDFEQVQVAAPGTAVVRYIERQSGDGSPSARRATAVFAAKDETTLHWLCVQETWIGDSGA